MSSELRVLIVEDMPTDAELVERQLGTEGIACVPKRVATLKDFEKELASFEPGLVLSDYMLQGFNGMDVLRSARKLAPRLPFVIITGSINEEIAVECMKAGADDYVLKEHLARLGTAVRGAIEKRRARRERELAEDALRESERRYRQLFKRNLAGVLRTEGDGHITDCNEACARIFGCASGEEMLTHHMLDFWADPLDRLAFVERLQEERSVSNFEVRMRRKDGTIIWALISAHLNGGGATEAAVFEATLVDITDRKRAEEYRALLASIVESSDDAVIARTLDGIIVSWNRGAEKTYGYSAAEVKGKPVSILLPPSKLEDLPRFAERLRRGESVDHYESVAVRKDGRQIDVSITLSPIRNEAGTVVAVSAVARDITERKRAEAENLRLATAIEQAGEGIVVTDAEGTMQYVNPAFTAMTGYTRAEAVGQNTRILRSGRHDSTFYEGLWATSLAGKPWHGEIIDRRKDGTLYPVDMTITPVRDSRGEVINFIAIKQDITERKRAQEALIASETSYRRLFEAAQDGILLLDLETARISDANPFVLKLLGYSREEILGKRLWEAGPFVAAAASQDAFRSLQKDGYVRYDDLPLETKSGDHLDVEFVSNAYRSDGQEVIQCNIRDITDRKRQEDLIRAALREKETLLKEIHHRVKNNLQVISSLLSLQGASVKGRAVRETLAECQQRVRAMALIYQKLCQSDDLSRIDFAEYLRGLAEGLFGSYRVNPGDVKLSVRAVDWPLDSQRAVLLGLIVNELVSNSLKHAFKPGQKGAINIELMPANGPGVTLAVRDDGVGFPKNLDFRQGSSLGLRLVCTLVEQLGGSIKLNPCRGTEFQLTLPNVKS